MASIEVFSEINKSLKGNNASEILKDIENRLWNINMVDRWTKEDREAHEVLLELQKIYTEIKEKEEKENGKK